MPPTSREEVPALNTKKVACQQVKRVRSSKHTGKHTLKPRGKKKEREYLASRGGESVASPIVVDEVLQRILGNGWRSSTEAEGSLFEASHSAKAQKSQVSVGRASTMSMDSGKKRVKTSRTQTHHRPATIPVSLEDEEDEAVAQQALQHTTLLLSKLSPAKRRQFWNLREVAQGTVVNEDTRLPESERTQRSEEMDHKADGSSDASSEPSWIMESDDEPLSTSEEGDEGSESELHHDNLRTSVSQKSTSRPCGAMFAANDAIWDDE